MCNLLPKPGFVTKQAHFYFRYFTINLLYGFNFSLFCWIYSMCFLNKIQYILFGYYDSCRFHLCILSVFPFDISIALSDYNTVEYENKYFSFVFIKYFFKTPTGQDNIQDNTQLSKFL